MSWLYTIVVAGLLFSSNAEPALNTHSSTAARTPAVSTSAQDVTERIDEVYPLNPNGRVSVSNVNGSIEVEAWDRSEVRLEATKIADSKETLAEVDIRIDARPEAFSVETDYPTGRWGEKGNHSRRLQVQFRMWVPRTAQLNEVETVNGSVTVKNFVNFTKISAVNGNVTASNLRGTANLSTVNGEVAADFDQLENTGKITLSTVNGRVNLVIPSDVNATIKADSLNGEIKNDFGLPVRKGQYVGRDLYGRVGSGEVQIRLNSVNGPLTVSRKNDGKSPKPATNLLPQKGKDDEDWDDIDTSKIDAAKMDREVARAVRESQRKTAHTQRQTRRSAASVRPELENLKARELPKLDKIKVDIDKEKLEKSVQQSLRQTETLRLMSTAAWSGGPPMIEKTRRIFSVKGTPRVNIEADGCSVKVRGWDKPEVQFVITEVSGQRGRSPVTAVSSQKDSVVTLTIDNPNEVLPGGSLFGDRDSVRVEVFVPRKSNLSIEIDGELRLDSVTGDIELDGRNGAINVRDVDGKLRLTAADSHVRVIGFKGELEADVAEAEMYLEGDFRRIFARGVEGVFVLTVPENTNASLTANTQFESEGLNIVKEDDETWRIGRGGARFNFDLTEGKLILRNAAEIASY